VREAGSIIHTGLKVYHCVKTTSSDHGMRHGDWHRLIATEGEILIFLTKSAANRFRGRPLLYDCQLSATLTTKLL